MLEFSEVLFQNSLYSSNAISKMLLVVMNLFLLSSKNLSVESET